MADGELWVDDDEQEVELARLIVAPAHRGQGVGRRIVTGLVEHAHRIHPTAFLRVRPENEAARRCYAAAGFARRCHRGGCVERGPAGRLRMDGPGPSRDGGLM